jgi:hypothetical protein
MKAWGKYLAEHLELGGRAARGGRRRQEKAAGVGRCGGEDTADKQGPLDRETREKRPSWEGANQKGKRISREGATDTRAGWAGRDGFDWRGRRDRWASWARGRAGRKVGRAESKAKKNFRIKIGFLNLARLWKFVEGDLGGILT